MITVDDVHAMIAEAHKYDDTAGGRTIKQALADLERDFGKNLGPINEDAERQRAAASWDSFARFGGGTAEHRRKYDADRQAFVDYVVEYKRNNRFWPRKRLEVFHETAQRLMRSAAAHNMFGGA